MFIYGYHPIRALLEFRPALLKHLWLSKGTKLQSAIPKHVFIEEGIPHRWKSSPHQGVVAQISEDQWIHPGKSWSFEKATRYVILDHLEDPQNMGAIARAAALLGADALVFATDRQTGVTESVVKASCGLIFALDLIEVTNLSAFLTKFKQKTKGWVYGLQLERAENITQMKPAHPQCLVVGSEAKGISKSVAGLCDAFYAIPMSREGHTLNVSQATAIALYCLSQS